MAVQIFPWVRHRMAIEEAQARAKKASLEAEAARLRRQNAEAAQRQAKDFSDRLRRQVERNGWTELLLSAWKGRV